MKKAHCTYIKPWVGPCNELTPILINNKPRCPKHANKKCVSCGAPAIGGCTFAGQFVCGYPLCGDCKHTEDVPGKKHATKFEVRLAETTLETDNG